MDIVAAAGLRLNHAPWSRSGVVKRGSLGPVCGIKSRAWGMCIYCQPADLPSVVEPVTRVMSIHKRTSSDSMSTIVQFYNIPRQHHVAFAESLQAPLHLPGRG